MADKRADLLRDDATWAGQAFRAYHEAVGSLESWEGLIKAEDPQSRQLVAAWKAAAKAAVHVYVLWETNEIIKAGHAGVLPNGNIVDCRCHPEAIPLKEPSKTAADSPTQFYIVFDGPPGPESGRFVEVETDKGRSVGSATTGAEWHHLPNRLWGLGPFGVWRKDTV